MTRSFSGAAAKSVVAVAGALFLLTPQFSIAAPAAPKSPADCRAITDFTLRGQCWDALDQQGLEDKQVQTKRSFGLGAKAPADAAVVAPPIAELKPEKPARERRQARNDGVNDLTLTLASVHNTALGRLLLISTDGAVWEQTDTDDIQQRPAAGDSVEVTKGQFGGYLCKVTRWQTIRCQRDE